MAHPKSWMALVGTYNYQYDHLIIIIDHDPFVWHSLCILINKPYLVTLVDHEFQILPKLY